MHFEQTMHDIFRLFWGHKTRFYRYMQGKESRLY